MIGQTLSHYQILEELGSGGMGVVYRARDTKLHRDVAIKVLPGAAAFPERLARFEREAHLLAALNHPNIATIHGLEEANGVHFLVLEVVEGETLAERIARGPLSVEDALPLFQKIAEGLEAAHEKGIIHRDLKPANIKITPDGRVKILDFGLGKVFEGAEAGRADLSQSPTITREGTRTGVILGTAAYMSPEQARGDHVDKRTDIWAFGCCLYEALTGKPAFWGATVTDIIASVVKSEPDWEKLPGDTPFLVRRVLGRCLEKDPSQRIHDVADARIDLRDAPSAAAVAESESKRASSLAYIVLLGLTTFGLGVLTSFVREPATAELPVTRLEIETHPLNDVTSSVALSRDGTKLAYVATDGQIYLRQMDRDAVVALASTEGARKPLFSPDGEWIAFHDIPAGKLKKIDVSGGAAVTLTDWGSGTGFGADWESEDTIVLCDADGMYRVPASGGARERLEGAEGNAFEVHEFPRYPDVLPGGLAILLTVGMFYGGENIELYRLDTGEREVLIENASFARYVPTGHMVFVRDDTLQAVHFDLDELVVQGEPVPVVENIHIRVTNGTVHYALSNSGSLAYLPADWNGFRRRLVWVDMEGNVEPIRSIRRRLAGPDISPDGERIALNIWDGTHTGLWLTEASRETLTPFLPGTWAYAARWSPDGERLAFVGPSEGNLTIFTASSQTGARPEEIGSGLNAIAWSPDGNDVAYQTADAMGFFDIWTVSLGGDHAPRPYLEGPYFIGIPDFSPDGRSLAYVSNESGRFQIYVQPFGREGQKHQVSTDGGMEPLWSPDGKEIYYRSGRRMMAVGVETEPTFTASSPRVLFEGDFLRNDIHGWVRNHDISPDGKRFLMVQSEEEPVFTKIKIVLNWFSELERLVPTR